MSLIYGLLLTAFVLFFFEIFLPGGILGLIGAGFVVLASALTYMDSGFLPALGIFMAGLGGGVLLLLIELKLVSSGPLGRRIRLDSAIDATVDSKESSDLVGKSGVTLTTLSPQGKLRIGENIYTAFAIEGYLPKGTPVEILRTEPFKLIVRKK